MMTKNAKALVLEPGSQWWEVQTPLGEMVLAGDDDALRWALLPGDGRAKSVVKGERGRPKSVALAEEQFRAYFAGELLQFDLVLDPKGTEWQKRVWRALEDIPYGETVSYGAVAAAVGNPKAARAVGGATNANPLPLVVPCHRVVGSDGGLVGFGGGLDLKAALLAHERKVLARRLASA
jgi:methylated-DNA-[protein]-cysteine S-methyltransferase